MDFVQVENFFKTADKESLDKYLDDLDKAYYCDIPKISDDLYDHYIDIYVSRFGEREKVGHEPTEFRAQLPTSLTGLNKITTEKALNKYMERFPGPYVISDKLDGHGVLLVYNYNPNTNQVNMELYSRGNGGIGENISHILQYIPLPKICMNIAIRGELIIHKSDHDAYFKGNANPRTTVGGVVRSKLTNPEGAKLIKFYAYHLEVVNSSDKNTSFNKLIPHHELSILSTSGFLVPSYTVVNQTNYDQMVSLLKNNREKAPYYMDGLVINQNVYHESTGIKRPNYMMAFKHMFTTAITVALNVEWNPTRYGYLAPTVVTEPVMIDGSCNQRFTAHNADFVYTNKIGPGTVLLVTKGGDIIPKILEVLKSNGEPQMPPDGDWEWDKNHVFIVLKNPDTHPQVRIKKIYEFFKQTGAKYIGHQTVCKLHEGGLDNIQKILEADIFKLSSIPGIKEKTAERIYNSIRQYIPNVTLPVLMSASGAFGRGMGKERLELILQTYPDILNMNTDNMCELIQNIKGFQSKTAKLFVDGLPQFKQFLEQTPAIKQLHSIEKTHISNNQVKSNSRKCNEKGIVQEDGSIIILSDVRDTDLVWGEIQPTDKVISKEMDGFKIVFSGHRDKDGRLTEAIKCKGGSVTSAVSGKTTLLVVAGDKGDATSKVKRAMELGIPIMTLKDFREKYNL